MPLTVVLAVGLDSSLLAGHNSAWQSAGYIVSFTGSIREAIVLIRDGDFDLVLLGNSIPIDSRERFAFLVRAIGSRTPVVCVTDSAVHRDSFADATVRNEPISLLQSIGELMAERPRSPVPSRTAPGIAACEA
jgi:DNA-binding NtrC family response regulator